MEVIEKKWEALQYLSADLQADREAELPRCEVRLGRTAKRPQPLSGSPRSARGQIRVKGPVDASAAGIVLPRSKKSDVDENNWMMNEAHGDKKLMMLKIMK